MKKPWQDHKEQGNGYKNYNINNARRKYHKKTMKKKMIAKKIPTTI
jgi:hypothetical protein